MEDGHAGIPYVSIYFAVTATLDQIRELHDVRRAYAWVRYTRHSRRRAAGCFDGRPGDAHLPDDIVCLQRRRSCRRAVQPRDLWQHLYADHESHPGGPRGAHGGSRRRHRRTRRRFWPRGPGCRPPYADGAWRRVRRRPATLWRFHQPVRRGLQEIRLACEMGRYDERGELPCGHNAEDEGDLR